jgi:hypothetical protein
VLVSGGCSKTQSLCSRAFDLFDLFEEVSYNWSHYCQEEPCLTFPYRVKRDPKDPKI